MAASYVVQAGDTLYGIAAKSGVATSDIPAWVANVVKLNGLADADHLSIGDRLQLPEAPTGGGASTPPATSEPTSPYTVQPGDTLSGIGSKLGAQQAGLADWIAAVVKINGLEDANSLTAGQKLQLPSAGTNQAQTPPPIGPQQSASPSLGAVPPPVPYTVQPGDSLRAIGAKLGVGDADIAGWIASVVKLNGLESADKLVAGQQLQLPAVGGGAGAGSAPPAAAAPSSGASLPYTIQEGDTIYSIGAKLGITGDALVGWVDQVLRLSGLTSTELLHPGQVIQIPVSDDNAALVKSPAPASNSTDAKPKPVATVPYTVQEGDTLSAIADKLGISGADVGPWITQVLDLNGLANANVLTVGQHLMLPGPAPTPGGPPGTQTANGPDNVQSESSCFYTVKGGDTWASIAAKLGIAERNFQAWVNLVSSMNGIDPTLLPVGDALRLPC
jgi:LysM repeat protein